MAVLGFLSALLVWKGYYINFRVAPVWDGGVYLLLARNMLSGQQLYEWFRPMLFSTIAAGVWSLTGENFLFVRYFNLTYTLISATILYFIIRDEKGKWLAFAGMALYATSLQVLIWSDHILVHGLTTLFSLLTLWALKKYNPQRWFLGGIFATLAVFARYTSVVIIAPIALAFLIHHKQVRLIVAAAVGAAIPLVVYHVAFPFVLTRFVEIWFRYGQSTGVPQPWYYYFANWYALFGILGLLAVPVLLMPSSYKSIATRPWTFWLLGSLVFFMITINKQDRFTFEWTPAVVYLGVTGLEKAHALLCRGFLTGSPLVKGCTIRTTKIAATAFLAGLIALQVFGSVNAYVPVQKSYAFSRDNNLPIVADWMKENTNLDDRFISDYEAPVLTYFSGRHVAGIWRKTAEPGYMEYLQRYIEDARVNYLIIFARMTGNSIDELEKSGFLELETALDAGPLGTVYILHYAPPSGSLVNELGLGDYSTWVFTCGNSNWCMSVNDNVHGLRKYAT